MRATLSLLAVLAVAACGGSDTAATPATTVPADDVTTALAVARGIDANPAASDSILGAHGLTRDLLDSLMYRIAADSAMSARYTAGRR